MAIHSFLKAERDDPDWQFSPDEYYGKEFKIIDAVMVDLQAGATDTVVLRQNPTEKEMLAKHLKVLVQANANLEMTIINDVDPKLQQVFLYDVHLEPGATLSLGIFAKDGKLNKHIIQVALEDDSKIAAFGLVSNECGGDTEIITKVVHRGAGSASTQLFLGLAGEESQTVYQGITIAESNAVESEINVENSNLVTGLAGRCFSKPENYTNAEFVMMSQASETDTISLEKISYLQSRGIPEERAREIVISGFRNQVIDIINSDSIRKEVTEMYVD